MWLYRANHLAHVDEPSFPLTNGFRSVWVLTTHIKSLRGLLGAGGGEGGGIPAASLVHSSSHVPCTGGVCLLGDAEVPHSAAFVSESGPPKIEKSLGRGAGPLLPTRQF